MQSSQALMIVPPPASWFRDETETSAPTLNPNSEQGRDTAAALASSTENENRKVSRVKKPSKMISTSMSVQQVAGQVPMAAQELISNIIRRAYHYTRISYANSNIFGKHSLRHSEVGSNTSGFNRRKFVIDKGIRDVSTGEILWEVPCGNQPHQLHLTLPAFSSLNWVDRQLVQEWRTCDYTHKIHLDTDLNTRTGDDDHEEHIITTEYNVDEEDSYGSYKSHTSDESHPIAEQDYLSEEEDDFEQAKFLMPKPAPRPSWEKASSCYTCQKLFGPTLLRHHCRLCGRSYCHTHSRFVHRLPHLGYDPDIPERVCASCKQVLDGQSMAERIAWRMARTRDYFSGELRPYFETGVDSLENAVYRVTKAAIKMAKSIPLGTQATVAVEVLDILRKHGLNGLYGLILRREFLEAADLLCKVTGINKSTFPLSFVDLTAAIFYSLAQQRALRGDDPEGEHRIHSLKENTLMWNSDFDHVATAFPSEQERRRQGEVLDLSDDYDPLQENIGALFSRAHQAIKDYRNTHDEESKIECTTTSAHMKQTTSTSNYMEENKCQENLPFTPVCDYVSESLLASLIFYAPVALNFMYATNEVDMQILAAQQGWRLVYAHLRQDSVGPNSDKFAEMPGFALFVHPKYNIACLGIRGTATINDVVTDIRALPVTFPEIERFSSNYDEKDGSSESLADEACWTAVQKGQGLALCGMAGAAYNLFHENIDALTLYARRGYRIRITGHSLGGAVATLLGSLIRRQLGLAIKNDELQCLDLDDVLRVYSYGSPACVDANLSDFCQSYVTNCVCHDDVIPRLTPTSIRGLLKHLLYIKSTWVNKNLSDDLLAITRRVKTGWAPKLRNGFTLLSAPASTLKACKKKFKAKELQQRETSSSAVESQLNEPKHSVEKLCSADIAKVDDSNSALTAASNYVRAGIYYDGDCFYEVEEQLIEGSDDESNDYSDDFFVPDVSETCSSSQCKKEPQGETSATDETEPQPVLMDELPLPRMYLPGKIVHIYTHRGGYKAAIVPRTFRELRRISMAGNMLNDHLGASYYAALLECMSIRRASERLPEWTCFNEETTWCVPQSLEDTLYFSTLSFF